MRRYEFANTPVQFIRLEAGLLQSSENVYVRQKALTRRAKSTIPTPDWAATITFSLAFTIAESIREAGKPAMEFSDFSRHRSFQSTVLPMLNELTWNQQYSVEAPGAISKSSAHG